MMMASEVRGGGGTHTAMRTSSAPPASRQAFINTGPDRAVPMPNYRKKSLQAPNGHQEKGHLLSSENQSGDGHPRFSSIRVDAPRS